MLSKRDALKKLEESIPRAKALEVVSLGECLGRVLAEDVSSDIDIPPFNRSAMDGYALRSANLNESPTTLKVVGVIPAGVAPTRGVNDGECMKIMTGASVPEGADAVVMVEHTSELDEGVVRIERSLERGANIAPQGQDVREGEVVLSIGTPIRPLEVGMLATLGRDRVSVFVSPKVAVIATGDELIEPGTGIPGPGQIRESNGFLLTSQVNALGMGIRADYLGIARDTPESVREFLEKAMSYDVIVFSGGVSMGDFDYVHHELKAQGLKVIIEKVAIKPGKPLLFGTLGASQRYVFGLPGNPVSSFCTFEIFVRPFLRGMMGLSGPHTIEVTATVKDPIHGRAINRTQHLPARTHSHDGSLQVSAVEWHGSGDLRGMQDANSFIIVEADEAPPSVGAETKVQLFEYDMLRLPTPRTR